MTPPRTRSGSAGHLDDHWSARLGGPAPRPQRGRHHHPHRSTSRTRHSCTGCSQGSATSGSACSLTVVDPSGGTGSDGDPTTEPEPLGEPTGRSLERALRTERLTLRPATADDAEATWRFRQLETVNKWLTGVPADLDGYREMFAEPARLSTTVIVELGRDPGGTDHRRLHAPP